MTTYELFLPDTNSPKRLLQLLPDEALIDTDLTASVLQTSVAALEKARSLHKGVPCVHLTRRRIRYRVKDLKRWLASAKECAA